MRFLLVLLLLGMLLVGLHLVGLYGFLPYATFGPALDAAHAAARLAHVSGPPQHLVHNADNYARLRAVAYALAAFGASGLFYARNHAKREARRLAHDTRRALQALGRSWQDQPRALRRGAVAGLLAVVALRTYVLLHNPFNPDELVTADYFVAARPAVTASFYLLPNNHVLQSLLAWPLLHWLPVGSADLWMRLPVFGLGLVGLAVGFPVLAHLTSLRVAALATMLFQLSPMAVEYATTARGYGPQVLCVQAGWLAALVLLRGPAGHRLAWAVWVASAVAGFYFIPTFLYPFAGSVMGLLVAARGRGRAPLRRQVLVAAAGAGGLAALLYLPVGWLTGWLLLFANPYVAPMTPAFFWEQLGSYYLPVLMVNLFGRAAMGWPLLGLLVLGPVALARWAQPGARLAAWLAWAGVVAPLPLLLAQRVMPPARTLHYTVWMAFLLAALVLEGLATRLRGRAKTVWVLVAAVGAGYTLLRLARQPARVLAAARQYDHLGLQVEGWLRAQHPRRTFTTVPGYGFYLRHRALMAGRSSPLVEGPALPTAASRDTIFGYLVLYRTQTPPEWLMPHCYRAAFCNELMCVYRYVGDARVLSPVSHSPARLP